MIVTTKRNAKELTMNDHPLRRGKNIFSFNNHSFTLNDGFAVHDAQLRTITGVYIHHRDILSSHEPPATLCESPFHPP